MPVASASTALAAQTLELSHLLERKPRQLSGGQRQRVAIARSMVLEPTLLLLDEPLGALDARLRLELRGQLRELAKGLGLTVVHVTHDQAEAMTIADMVVVLRDGRVEQTGTPFHIYHRPGNIFVANFIGDTNFIEGIVAAGRPGRATIAR